MSEEEKDKAASEIILVGGSKDGSVTAYATGLNSVHNIVLNDDKDGPKYVDRYVPTGVQDRQGRDVYAHVGRYSAEESQSFWESLEREEVERLIAAQVAEEEAAKAEEEAAKETETEVTQDAETGEVAEKPAEETEEKPAE